LRLVAERLVVERNRVRGAQHVAHAQAGDRQRRGQLAIEQARFQPLLAPDHVEVDTALEQVDRLAVPVDFEPVHGEVAFVGQPADAEGVLLHQRLRIVDADRAVVIRAHHAVFDAVLEIGDQFRRPAVGG
jgi:hypothetical protein